MELSEFKKIEPTLPLNPGIYKFFDADEKLLYIGKAKNLKKRISSYFLKQDTHSGKLLVMVRKVSKIDFTIVETEQDALLLENTLIKKFQPRYNVALKDDKTYSSICIKKERFPRVFQTRKIIKDGSEYFGPYSSGTAVYSLLEFIRSVFPLRNCNLNLTEENIKKKKFKVCLEYHLGNCKGPCEALQNEEDYNNNISQIRNILKGNVQSVIQYFKQQMEIFAKEYQFEKANEIKDKVRSLQNYQSKSTVVNPKINNVDVFSISETENNMFVNYLKVVKGSIIQTKTIELIKKIEEESKDVLSFAVNDLRQQFGSTAKEIIVPMKIDLADKELKIIVPKKGDKKKLLELSEKNVFYFKNQKLISEEKTQTLAERILKQMQSDLRLKELPVHIECFDNSNLQGSFPVASLVVFKNARPFKKDYRHFNIKTVEGPNDFASMEEIVFRRYKRLQEENQSLPQLIIIDGGKGQLSSAMNSLEKLNLLGKIPLIGIAKKLEEIYFPHDSLPLHINKKSETLRLIQQIRNEAHRFAITFHRNKRSKHSIQSELVRIKGIGKNSMEKLLGKYKSVQKIKEVEMTDIEKEIGKKRAEILFDYFSKTKKPS